MEDYTKPCKKSCHLFCIKLLTAEISLFVGPDLAPLTILEEVVVVVFPLIVVPAAVVLTIDVPPAVVAVAEVVAVVVPLVVVAVAWVVVVPVVVPLVVDATVCVVVAPAVVPPAVVDAGLVVVAVYRPFPEATYICIYNCVCVIFMPN